ncbi:hypothetical protein DL93DRAFT_2166146 [Clavulina sp. PMI_390]|nr:hypothetical protein DL93DRAFT_2166146 [Clavulina sp. PMI_390]
MFCELPTDILIAIFCCDFDAQDIASLGQTCRRLYEISLSNPPWIALCDTLSNKDFQSFPHFRPPVFPDIGFTPVVAGTCEMMTPPGDSAISLKRNARSFYRRVMRVKRALSPPEYEDMETRLPSVHLSITALSQCPHQDFIAMAMSWEGDILVIALTYEIRVVDLETGFIRKASFSTSWDRGPLPPKRLITVTAANFRGRRGALIYSNILGPNGPPNLHFIYLDSVDPEDWLSLGSIIKPKEGLRLAYSQFLNNFLIVGFNNPGEGSGSRSVLDVYDFNKRGWYYLPAHNMELRPDYNIRIQEGRIFISTDTSRILIYKLQFLNTVGSANRDVLERDCVVYFGWGRLWSAPMTFGTSYDHNEKVTMWKMDRDSIPREVKTATQRYQYTTDCTDHPTQFGEDKIDHSFHIHNESPRDPEATSLAARVNAAIQRQKPQHASPARSPSPIIISTRSCAGLEHVLTLVKTTKPSTNYLMLSTCAPTYNINRTLKVFRDGKASEHGLIRPGQSDAAVSDILWSDMGGRIAVKTGEGGGGFFNIDVYSF